MLTNIVWSNLDGLGSIKCSGNWMWSAKLPHEDAALYDTCRAMCDLMEFLGIAIDGGKDSLSMASKCTTEGGQSVFVKSPGTLVVSGYCSTSDVTKKVTPDLKGRGDSVLLLIDLGKGKNRYKAI
jgi:phosphoribosylformylglycinamidine synthase